MCGNPKETNSPLTALEDDKKGIRQKDAKSYKMESLYSLFNRFANHPFLKQRASVDLSCIKKNKKRVFMQNLITLRVYIRKKTKEIINFVQVFC